MSVRSSSFSCSVQATANRGRRNAVPFGDRAQCFGQDQARAGFGLRVWNRTVYLTA